MNIFKKIKARLQLIRAIKLADKCHAEDGGRYYVMPTFNRTKSGKRKHALAVIDRSNFRKLKQKHYISQRASVADLLRECFYHTPYRDGSGEIPKHKLEEKLAQYYRWRSNPV